jgi:exosortase
MNPGVRYTRLWPVLALTLSGLLLYASVLRRLVQDWWTDDNYSHGFVIAPLAAYFVYERWGRLRDTPSRPSTVLGLLVIAGSLFLLAAGTLGSEFFLTRISFVLALAGVVLFLAGTTHLRVLTFPLAFLLLSIPIPAILFNQIAFPLQLIASRLGEGLVSSFGVPVLREGNVIVLASTTLEVAEACSGIRSLVSLLTLGIVFGYFTDRRTSARVLLALSTIPLAIAANGIRVAGTGIAAHYLGPAAAEGFFHSFSGWLVFVTAFLMLVAVERLIRLVLPKPAVSVQVTPEYSS